MKKKIFQRGLLFIVVFFVVMITFTMRTTERDKKVVSNAILEEQMIVSEPPVTRSPVEELVSEQPNSEMNFISCDETVYVNTERLNVRSEPSIEEGKDTVVMLLSLGDVVHRIGYSDEWSMVQIEGEEEILYVMSEYLSLETQ